MEREPSILIGVPSYDGNIRSSLSSALMNEARVEGVPPFTMMHKQVSLLAFGFNQLLATALNNRNLFTHFMMLHADVLPRQLNFLRTLVDEATLYDADILSCVLPLKDEKGLTSTCLIPDLTRAHDLGVGRPKRRRLTMRELAQFPKTFDVNDCIKHLNYKGINPALLVNTGMMLVDLRKPWVEKVWFTINDRVWQNDEGIWGCDVEPEDWYYSAEALMQGAKVMATTAVNAAHIGTQPFPNQGAWGTWKKDETLDGGDYIGVKIEGALA